MNRGLHNIVFAQISAEASDLERRAAS